MLKKLNAIKVLILVGLLTIAGLVAIGYFSASKKSEPKYRSKIEQIIYDTKNKSPKYVLTLPDRNPKVKKEEVEKVAIQNNEVTKKEEEKVDPLQEAMKNLPHLTALGKAQNKNPLKFVEPNPDLIEEKGELYLPKTDRKQKPWEVYGKKVNIMPQFFKVAVVVKNYGVNQANATLIADGLPDEVSFSFSPYALNIKDQVIYARNMGHETYMDFLLPSKDYLKSDSGPLSMSLTTSFEENLNRLLTTIGGNFAIGGMVVSQGIADDSNVEQLSALLAELQKRGLLMLDASGEDFINNMKIDNLARLKADVVIENDFSREGLEKKLTEAENIAREKGRVVIVIEPKPSAILALSDWFKSFSPQLSYEQMKEQNITEIEKPFALVPISNLVVE